MTEQAWLKESSDFQLPVSTSAIDVLLAEYRNKVARIRTLSETVGTDDCVSYFIAGNSNEHRYSLSVSQLFSVDAALGALNSDYWSRAMALTDVLDVMNNDRRNDWSENIRNHKCPAFEESTVRDTIKGLLLQRDKFFAERVDGIFRNLSGEHVTNSPMGFNRRMIIAGVHGQFSWSYKQAGYISDLRIVIAKFMGRDAPHHSNASQIIDIALKQTGKWLVVDGGALRIRVYLKGTAHLEVHPDIAWRLNCVLADLHPHAIPSEFRKKPTKKAKEFDLLQKPLPFAVINLLAGMRKVYEPTSDNHRPTHKEINHALDFDYADRKSFAVQQAEQVLTSIGGVKIKHYWQFDYAPQSVIDSIVASGCIPDYKSHQYYPTPENIARDAVVMAEIGELDICLEPSAGQGGLADFMPKERTLCIEISGVHCEVLWAKGHSATNVDFINFNTADRYDRIVMNPPYSQGRWQAHLEHAYKFLADDGILVAILPASVKGKDLIPGTHQEFSKVYVNEFEGTSVSVVICKIKNK